MKLNFHTPIRSNADLNQVIAILKDKGCIKSTVPYGTIIGDEYTVSELKKANPKDYDIKAINVGLYLPHHCT